MNSPDEANDENFYDAEADSVYFELEMEPVEGQMDQRQVYFELEKNSGEGQEGEVSREDKYKTAPIDLKGQTIKKANVNVLHQAKLFEQDANFNAGKLVAAHPNHVNDEGQREMPVKGEQEESIYELASAKEEENVYEFAMFIPPDANIAVEQSGGGDSEYVLASAINPSVAPPWTGSLGTVKSVNIGCQEGVSGAPVPVDFIHPVSGQPDDSSEYSRLYFQCVASAMTEEQRQMLRAKGYGTIDSFQSNSNLKSSGSEYSDASEDDNVSIDWGSEFDDYSYQDCEEEEMPEPETKNVEWYTDLPEKPLPRKPGKAKPYQALIPKQLRSTSHSDELSEVDLTSSAVCLPVNIDPDKHPPPSLPTQPDGLSDEQKKRRCVIDLIISSERSYVESLERIIKQYEKPILESISHPRAHVRIIFAVIREVISHHKMFSIELAECVNRWDDDEKIGDIFTASFSKTMVVNAYSVYVNNFSAAMEEIRSMQRNKQAFDEFLKKREKSNADRLSIFGLMVKPVQRFPQFIMCLQDLIKYMPQDHHDRRALQLALTELENVTHMLNERKRRSEQRFQAVQTIHQLTRQKAKHMLTAWNLDTNSKRSLIRYDMVDEVSGEFGQMKCKNRRLILMNDLVLCVKVIEKEHGGFPVERLGLRWIAKLKDLELKDTAITPDMESVIKKEPGKIHIISSQLDKSENDPFHLYADLSEMLHDYTVLGQISGLVSTLKRSYVGHGLREELVHEISRDLQCMIQIKDEQLRLVNSCSIVLVDNSRSEKLHYVLQTQTAAIKQDWCVDFLMAKLALHKKNCLAWDAPHGSDDHQYDPLPAHFMKHLSVDVPRNYTKIRCAVSIYLTPEKSQHGVGVQHLWVCSSSPTRGQVSILSIHNSKPSLTEAFSACNCDILCVELVPGCGEETVPGRYLFVQDTVWMATSHRQILIFPLSNFDGGVRRDPLVVMENLTLTISIRFVDERIFCGHENGTMDVISRGSDGAWEISKPTCLMVGVSLVQTHFVWEEDLWISCGNKIHIVEIDSLETKATHELPAEQRSSIDQVVQSGMGVWVSFHNSSVIKLFHLETLENLQEISIGNFLQRMASEKLWTLSSELSNVVVTSLAASKGLLWVGTSLGVVLTVPLPRLSDGVPLYRGRPGVSLHAHRGPVKFLLPLMYATNTLELNRSSSLRSTLRSRQSRRNIEREKLEFLESEKRKGSLEIDPNGREDYVNVRLEESKKHLSLPMSVKDGKYQGSLNAADKKEEDSAKDKGKGKKDKGKKKQIEKKKSFDDSEVALQRKGSSGSLDTRRKTQTLSFRSELANRIVYQADRLSRSSLDLTQEQPLEVEMLYENLLEDDLQVSFDRTSKRSVSSRRSLLKYRSPFSSTPKESETEADSLTASTSSIKKAESNSKVSNVAKHLSPSPSSSSQSSGESTPPAKSSTLPPKSGNSQSITRNSTLRTGTMRKGMSCNAVIVLSGGDGYQDLDKSRSQAIADDACVLLWIYKF